MIFKFTTERPSATTIWETVDALSISMSEGYTDFQIKFMIGIILCSTEFKQAKHAVNEYITQKAPLLRDITRLFSVVVGDNWTYLKDTRLPPADLPSFVDASLYVPYYILMQLHIPKSSSLWFEPFDRQVMKDEESEYIAANYLPLDVSITAYKLWLTHEPTVVVEYYSRIFQIEMSQPPAFITSRDDLIMTLNGELLEYLDYHTIYTYEQKIHITPFQLGGPNAPSQI